MVVFDANVLVSLVSKSTSADDLARLHALIEELSKSRSYVSIPTPVLAEFLVRTDAATQAVLSSIERKSGVRVQSFDRKAAVECAMLDAKARLLGGKRGSAKNAPYQKVKVDRQIVAIAITNRADMIVSGDDTLIAVARDAGLLARKIEELPLPASALQRPLNFEADSAVEDVTSKGLSVLPSGSDAPGANPPT